MPESTIGAGFVRALMELAVSKGASRKELAERSRIDSIELQDQDNRIPFSKYIALMRAGKELCHDPALALHFGEAFDMADISIVGALGSACETAAGSLRLTNRYARLVADLDGVAAGDRYQLSRASDGLWVVDTRKNPNAFPELTESSFARIVCACRRRIGDAPIVKAIHVTHAEPAYRAEYDRIFRMPVVFESDKNALLTDDKWLSHKVASSSRYAFGILSAHADALLKRLEISKSTRDQVENMLMSLLRTGDANMDTVAAKLGFSRQTLFRRLKAEGVTFENVLDELRYKMALHYLNEQRVSVNETAYLVGFSDPAAFSRAFKRWTGSSPRMMRSRN